MTKGEKTDEKQTIADVNNRLDEFIRTNSQNYSNLVSTIDARVDSKLEELKTLIMSLNATGVNSKPSVSGVSQKDDNKMILQNVENQVIPKSQTMKLEVPKFDGTDPSSWTFKIDEYFNFHQTPEDQRLRIVSFHIEGKASAWYQWVKANNLLTTWTDFLSKVKLSFGASQFEDYEGKLSKLTQMTTVAEFQSEFEDLMNKVRGIPESLLVSFFITGLKPNLKREVQLNIPNTLEETFSLPRVYEEKYNESQGEFKFGARGYNRSNLPQTFNKNLTNYITPTENTNRILTSQNNAFTQNTNTNRNRTLPLKNYFTPEMREKRAKGICYWCDGKWASGHVCKNKIMMLFGDDLEYMDDGFETGQDEQEDLTISGDISGLHSLTGQTSPRSLRVLGKVENRDINVLIDSGSTHNFIEPTLAEALELKVTPISPFRVIIGNGDFLVCNSLCPDVKVELQGTTFKINFHILQIKGPGMVLGIPGYRA